MLGALLLALTSSCSGAAPREAQEALVLRGFQLVDVETRSVSQQDLVIESGVVVQHPTLKKQRIIEGHGRFLMPALWDLKASLWGNNSTQDWEVLAQEINFTRCLALHLYYGVAHVGSFAMDREWAERGLKRADALGLVAAETLYPDNTICDKKTFGCDAVDDAATAEQALAARERRQVPFVEVVAREVDPGDKVGVSAEVLAAVLAAATKHHLPALVLVDQWAQAERAVQLGASVIYGLPDGPMPDSLIELMREKQVAFAPALMRYLELNRLLGNEKALSDPFLTATLQAAVRDSYRSERGLWHEWRSDLAIGRARQKVSLESVARAARAGVKLVAVTDAGWAAGAFQGYSSHAAQAWLERAGLDDWTRLSAATVWPAAVVGRHVGFQPGQAADFLALDADPRESAENLRKISFVMRKGELVDRDKLLPDLERGKYQP